MRIFKVKNKLTIGISLSFLITAFSSSAFCMPNSDMQNTIQSFYGGLALTTLGGGALTYGSLVALPALGVGLKAQGLASLAISAALTSTLGAAVAVDWTMKSNTNSQPAVSRREIENARQTVKSIQEGVLQPDPAISGELVSVCNEYDRQLQSLRPDEAELVSRYINEDQMQLDRSTDDEEVSPEAVINTFGNRFLKITAPLVQNHEAKKCDL